MKTYNLQESLAYNNGYLEGMRDTKKKYEGVTIDGLKATMEVMEIALVKKDMRIKELEIALDTANQNVTILARQLSDSQNELSWANEPICY